MLSKVIFVVVLISVAK